MFDLERYAIKWRLNLKMNFEHDMLVNAAILVYAFAVKICVDVRAVRNIT